MDTNYVILWTKWRKWTRHWFPASKKVWIVTRCKRVLYPNYEDVVRGRAKQFFYTKILSPYYIIFVGELQKFKKKKMKKRVTCCESKITRIKTEFFCGASILSAANWPRGSRFNSWGNCFFLSFCDYSQYSYLPLNGVCNHFLFTEVHVINNNYLLLW